MKYKVGQQFVEYVTVHEIKRAKTKTGKDFLIPLLGNASILYTAKVWSEEVPLWNNITTGDILKIGAEVVEYNNTQELKILKFREITPEELAALPSDHFVARAANDKIATAKNTIKECIKTITNPSYLALLGVIFSDPELSNSFYECPAAKRHHEAYIGGLAVHTANVLSVSLGIASTYPYLNTDLVKTAAILHDIGKIQSYSYKTVIDVTDQGCLIDHIALGIMTITRAWGLVMLNEGSKTNQLDFDKLVSAVLSSHGQLEYGSPITPKTPEAFIVAYADLIDTKVSNFKEETDKNVDGKKNCIWSDSFKTFIWAKSN
jgi:3'-5' exoribonuclease